MAQRTNEQWLLDLREPGPAQEAALAALRAVVMAGLPYALSKWLSPGDPKFEPLAEEVAQDTLLRVLDKMDTFEGLSKFTTWVHTIAVRLAITELRRRRWRIVSLDDLVETEEGETTPLLVTDPAPGPEAVTERADLLVHIQQIIMNELTEKQRQAMIAVAIKGMPVGEVARRIGMKRNALYKMMHDARLRLKKRLEREGLLTGEVLVAFEEE